MQNGLNKIKILYTKGIKRKKKRQTNIKNLSYSVGFEPRTPCAKGKRSATPYFFLKHPV